jgi:serine/threonine-protein kinase HipA
MIATLEVRWHDGRLVGHLADPGRIVFAYTPDWLDTKHNLSPCQVPFSQAVFRHRAEEFDFLPGFLADCLPDQWGQRLLQNAFAQQGIVNPSALQRLAWVGRRGIGALHFQPVATQPGSWEKVSALTLSRFAEAVLRDEPASAYQLLVDAGTVGGALPKATVALLPDGSLLHGGDVVAAAKQYPRARLGLLKLDCELPGYGRCDGRNEHAYMMMARAAGIRCSNTELVPVAGVGRRLHNLFVERFDVDAGTGRRHHVVTLAGMAHSFNLTYGQFLSIVQLVTQDAAEVSETIRRMIFNVRAGNGDDHGKNHSFIYDEARHCWQLSPAYDITFSYAPGRRLGGLSNATFGMEPRADSMRALAVAAGLTPAQYNALDEQVRHACGRWDEFAAACGLEERDAAQAAQTIKVLRDAVDGAPLDQPRLREARSRSGRRRFF